MKSNVKSILAVAVLILVTVALFSPFIGLGHDHGCCELECSICRLAIDFKYRLTFFVSALVLLSVARILFSADISTEYTNPVRQSLTSQKIKLLN